MGEVITNFIVEYQKGIFIFCGLYLIWGSLRNFDWFNAGTSARRFNQLVGRGGTRVIYFVFGVGFLMLSILAYMTDVMVIDLFLVLKKHPTQFIDFVSAHL